MKTEELLRYRAMYREMRSRFGARFIVFGFRPAEGGGPDEIQRPDGEADSSPGVESGSKPCETL